MAKFEAIQNTIQNLEDKITLIKSQTNTYYHLLTPIQISEAIKEKTSLKKELFNLKLKKSRIKKLEKIEKNGTY